MTLNPDAAFSRGDVMRRLAELERQMRAGSTARRLESATIGEGGLAVRGGAIRIQDPAGSRDLAVLSSDGIFIGGNPLIIPGGISYFAGPANKIPPGWLVCDGTAVSRTTFADLFAAIGTTWGAGDGATTFNLPDLRDRMLLGAGLTFGLGASGGDLSHDHTNPSTGDGGAHEHNNPSTGSAGGHAHSNPSTGSAGVHDHAGATGATSSLALIADPAGQISDASGHTHPISSDGSHSHTQGSTGSVGDHSHTVGTTGTQPAHTHSVGATGSASSLPPFAAVLPIIRT